MKSWVDVAHNPGRWVAAVTALLSFGLYLATLAPSVLEADAGEFQFVPWLPGIAHPPGYPLYTLLGWFWTHLLPLGEVAWRMNLLSAVCGALAVGGLCRVAEQMLNRTFPEIPDSARLIGAAVAALTFAVTPTFWSQAIIAEVYALHTLIIVALLWLTTQVGLRPWAGLLLAVAVGLGLAHHVTTILLVPAILLYLGLKRRQAGKPLLNLRGLAWGGALTLVPLLLYLYLPLVAPSTPYATVSLSDTQRLVLYEQSARGFFEHVTATAFTGDLQPDAVSLERLRLVMRLFWEQFGWIGIIMALIGMFVLGQRGRFALLGLTGLSFLAIVSFNIIYFIGDVFVLFIPAWLIACLWLGLAVLDLSHYLANGFIRRKIGSNEHVAIPFIRERLEQGGYRTAVTVLPLFFFALPLMLAISNAPQVSQRSNTAAQERWQTILAEPIPQSAILISNDRNEIMPMWYYQYVKQRRPDLQGLFPLITPDPAVATVGGVLDQAFASGRPTYFIKPMPGLSLKANLEPFGSLVKATPFETAPFYSHEAELTAAGETVRLLGYSLSAPNVSPGTSITATLFWQPATPLNTIYTSYVHLLNASGERVAQSDHQPGGELYPSRLWQVGESLRDTHTLSLPLELPDGLYQLRAGLYHQPEPGTIVNLGEGVRLGALAVQAEPPQAAEPPAGSPQARFGASIVLLDYDIILAQDGQLLVNFTWQALSRLNTEWTVFVHLRDETGEIVVQQDSQPRGGAYPTTVWRPQERVQDSYVLDLPPSLRNASKNDLEATLAGNYDVAVGLYNTQTGERLPLVDDSGAVLGDTVTLSITL